MKNQFSYWYWWIVRLSLRITGVWFILGGVYGILSSAIMLLPPTSSDLESFLPGVGIFLGFIFLVLGVVLIKIPFNKGKAMTKEQP